MFDGGTLHFAPVLVQRSIDLTAPGIHPRRHSLARSRAHQGGERVQCRHANERLPHRKRQPLHRRDAHAQSRERSWSDRHGKHVDRIEATLRRIEERDQIAR